MLYPSIQELLKLSTDENGEERLNKYTLVMATAKTARIITNENRVKKDSEKSSNEKSYGKKEYKYEKAVRTAVKNLRDGEYEIYFEGDEGYETSTVDVRALDIALEEELQKIEELEKLEKKKALEKEKYSGYVIADDDDDDDTAELMGADEVYTETEGFDERYEDPSVSGEN